MEAIRALLIAKRSGRKTRDPVLEPDPPSRFHHPRPAARTVPGRPQSPPRATRAAALRPERTATDVSCTRRSSRCGLSAAGSSRSRTTCTRPRRRTLAPAGRRDRAELLACHGVGVDTAAILLVAAGDNPERIRNEAAWAHLCGVAPLPASSGKRPPASPQPRREPPSEPCAVADRVHPHGLRRPHPRLRRASHRRRTHPNPRSCASSSVTSPARPTGCCRRT